MFCTNPLYTLTLVIEAVQEEFASYPTQIVPSGARYIDLTLSDRTEVYEFRSTEPSDPRNCRIRLPPLTDATFGTEESATFHNYTTTSIISCPSLTYRMGVETGESSEENSTSDMHNNQS